MIFGILVFLGPFTPLNQQKGMMELETFTMVANAQTPCNIAVNTNELYVLGMDDNLELYVEDSFGNRVHVTRYDGRYIVPGSKIYPNVSLKVYGRNFDSITLDEFEMIVERVFLISGDLSFETQVAVASVVFNRLESTTYPNGVKSVLGNMGLNSTSNYIYSNGSCSYWYSDSMDSVCEAVQAVINNDPNVPSVPNNVTGITTDVANVDKSMGQTEWVSDCIEGLIFYVEK